MKAGLSKRFLISVLILIFLSSCESKEKKKDEEDVKKQEQLNEFINGKGAILLSDTVAQYTYKLQDIFLKQHKLLALSGEIFDVYHDGNLCMLKIISFEDDKQYVAELLVDSSKIDVLKRQLKYDDDVHQNGYFILTVSNIISKGPEIDYKLETDDKDRTPYITSDEENKRLLVIKGTLVDFKLNN